ncbi:hypothetical protein CKA32_003742 [Geitlerinema sp. FC II]|nr:hypothetical protein CKA32_003742 [Geitlerinema sp. FC II]
MYERSFPVRRLCKTPRSDAGQGDRTHTSKFKRYVVLLDSRIDLHKHRKPKTQPKFYARSTAFNF